MNPQTHKMPSTGKRAQLRAKKFAALNETAESQAPAPAPDQATQPAEDTVRDVCYLSKFQAEMRRQCKRSVQRLGYLENAGW